MTEGMTGVLTKPLMFLSSYTPLFVMLAVRWFDASALWIACTVAAAVGALGIFLLLLRQHNGPPALDYTVVEAQPAGTEASAYLAGYLLPFLTVAEPRAKDLIAYGLFLLVTYAVHIRTGIIQVNPMLFVLGWRVLRITTTPPRQEPADKQALPTTGPPEAPSDTSSPGSAWSPLKSSTHRGWPTMFF